MAAPIPVARPRHGAGRPGTCRPMRGRARPPSAAPCPRPSRRGAAPARPPRPRPLRRSERAAARASSSTCCPPRSRAAARPDGTGTSEHRQPGSAAEDRRHGHGQRVAERGGQVPATTLLERQHGGPDGPGVGARDGERRQAGRTGIRPVRAAAGPGGPAGRRRAARAGRPQPAQRLGRRRSARTWITGRPSRPAHRPGSPRGQSVDDGSACGQRVEAPPGRRYDCTRPIGRGGRDGRADLRGRRPAARGGQPG